MEEAGANYINMKETTILMTGVWNFYKNYLLQTTRGCLIDNFRVVFTIAIE